MLLKENIVEALIGAAVLALGGWFLAYAYSTTDAGKRTSGYELTANFENASGVAVGTDVRISGLKVGSVIAQGLDPQSFAAKVTMVVDKSIELPVDTTAVITSEGLLGGNYLELKPGFEPDVLKPGDQLLYTQGSVDLLTLIGRFIGNSDSKAGAEPATPAAPPVPALQ